MTPRRALPLAIGAILVVALAGSLVAAVAVGPAGLGIGDVAASIAARLGGGASPLSPLQDAIVWELRLPRAVTAAAVGAGLALVGVAMQALTRTPLADPYLLGISSGATLGAVSVLLLGVALLLPVAAFAGALLALLATLGLSAAAGGSTASRTVLAGVAVSALAAALASLVIFLTARGDSYREVLSWLLGSLAGARWEAVAIASSALVVLGIPLALSGRVLDAIALGDATAASLGVAVGPWRVGLLVVGALLTGALVSVSGAIGFVGLVVPHAVRLVTGPRHRPLLPLAALAGAVTLVGADTLARTALDPRELPVGVVTALLGAPVFAILLVRRRAAT